MNKKRALTFPLCLLLIVLFFSCNSETDNSLYFKALVSLQKDDVSTAVNLLQKGIENSNQYFSSLCIIKLAEFEPKSKIVKYAKKFDINQVNDSTIYENLLKLYFNAGEYKTIIAKTTQDFDNNNIQKLRLLSLYKTGNSLLQKEESDWFSLVPFSTAHSEYLKERFDKIPFLYDARNLLYKQNYQAAFNKIQTGFNALTNDEKITYLTARSEIELSDIGKILLYSNANKIEYASVFLNSANSAQNDESKFYFLFYAARLFEREGKEHYAKAKDLYNSAMQTAKTPEKYDNALWYFLRTSNNISKSQGKALILQYASTWNDPTYFDDLMATCTSDFLTAYKWQDFSDFYTSIAPHLSNASKGKMNYIVGRLLEKNLIKTGILKANNLFLETYNDSKADLYYRVLAAERLNLISKDFADFSKTQGTVESIQTDSTERTLNNYEIHLSLLVEYGFFDEVYDFYMLHCANISNSVILECLKTLSEQGERYYYDCIKMAAKAIDLNGNAFAIENLKYTHPRFFANLVEQYAKAYDLPEFVVYGLIRTESYFNPKIVSSAGAVGLCQLMPSTASDIARKLKITDYDLTNANTNINFGTFYLQELTGRLDKNVVFALCSYNAGINRVRTWAKASPKNLPMDLFIETIPYEETREYGKKIVSAGVLYGLLYYKLSPFQVVTHVFGEL